MNDQIVRQQLINMLTVRQAHMTFEDAVANFPEEHMNTKPQGLDHTFWHLIEHIRICQWDILDYIRNADYVAPDFPKGLWAAPDAKADKAAWDKTIEQFKADSDALVAIIKHPETDLYAQIPHGAEGHNILREILVIADHNGYHIGELGILRQNMGLW
ncbi:MAG: DinB family protein [Anaerolineae bacterium]|nr:DinB family protein [Anaerolineae bacterium]MDQ7033889.1 DinB family protein [Anaerolineae bacterium]